MTFLRVLHPMATPSPQQPAAPPLPWGPRRAQAPCSPQARGCWGSPARESAEDEGSGKGEKQQRGVTAIPTPSLGAGWGTRGSQR